MSISRRAFLASIPALYAALKNIDLDMEPVKVLLPPVEPPPSVLGGTSLLQKFRVDFPDGASLSFNGFVTHAETQLPVDSLATVQMDIQPTGEMEYTPPVKGQRRRPNRKDAIEANATEVSFNGKSLGDVQEIRLPQVRRTMIDISTIQDSAPNFMEGLRRPTPLMLTVAWDEKAPVSLSELMGQSEEDN